LQDITVVETYYGGEIQCHLLIRKERVPTNTRNLLRGNRSNKPGRVRLETGNKIRRWTSELWKYDFNSSKITRIKWKTTVKP